MIGDTTPLCSVHSVQLYTSPDVVVQEYLVAWKCVYKSLSP